MTLSISNQTVNLKTVTTQANSADPVGVTRGQIRRVKATAHPTQNTNVGIELVQFVVPFTRGECISAADIKAYAADNTTEIKVFAKDALRWYNWDDSPSQFIRSAIVTVELTFANTNDSQDFYIGWGEGAPTLTLPEQVNELNWVDYRTSGLQWSLFNQIPEERRPLYDFQRDTYGKSRENIMEPRTWVTLPTEYLRYSEIFTPYTELGGSENTDIETAKAFWTKAMDTMSNEDGTHVKEKQLCPHMFDAHPFATSDTANSGKTFEGSGYACWVGDRGSFFAQRYILTGNLKDLIRAHRNCYYYCTRIENGIFMPKLIGKGDNDGKYLYARTFLSSHFLTGMTSMLPKIEEMKANIKATVNSIYHADINVWTEREAAVWLGYWIAKWEYDGSKEAKDEIVTTFTNYYAMQQTPFFGGQKDGSLRHYVGHHEGYGGANLIGSPWMSNMLLGEIIRLYEHSLDTRCLTMMYDLSQFVSKYALYENISVVEYAPKDLVPYYYASIQGYKSDSHHLNDSQHAQDVMHLMARGRWAADLLGHDYTVETAQLRRLITTVGQNTRYFIRTSQATLDAGFPVYRVDPYRSFIWKFGGQGGEMFKLVEDL